MNTQNDHGRSRGAKMDMTQEMIENIESLPFHEDTWDATGEQDQDVYDDCMVHITRRGKRFVFYDGDGKDAFQERHVKIFAKHVDSIIKAGDGSIEATTSAIIAEQTRKAVRACHK